VDDLGEQATSVRCQGLCDDWDLKRPFLPHDPYSDNAARRRGFGRFHAKHFGSCGYISWERTSKSG
jgi:hypothetical protein